MEKMLAEIKADIAKLHEHAAKYRKLAEERRAADHGPIADKLLEYVADLEAKADGSGLARGGGLLFRGHQMKAPL
jgi:hypothetical protein